MRALTEASTTGYDALYGYSLPPRPRTLDNRNRNHHRNLRRPPGL